MASFQVVEEAGLGGLPPEQLAGFRIAFERWTAEDCQPGLAKLIRASLDELGAVAAGK